MHCRASVSKASPTYVRESDSNWKWTDRWTTAALARIHELAESFLANTVIEDFTVKVEEVAEAGK